MALAMPRDLAAREKETATLLPVIPGGVKRRPGIHAEVLWIPAFAVMTVGGFCLGGNALVRERIQADPSSPSFRAE